MSVENDDEVSLIVCCLFDCLYYGCCFCQLKTKSASPTKKMKSEPQEENGI